MDWFFDGIGTLLVGLLIGGLGGGAVGWRIGRISLVRQRQVAGDDAEQSQVGGNQILHSDEDS